MRNRCSNGMEWVAFSTFTIWYLFCNSKLNFFPTFRFSEDNPSRICCSLFTTDGNFAPHRPNPIFMIMHLISVIQIQYVVSKFGHPRKIKYKTFGPGISTPLRNQGIKNNWVLVQYAFIIDPDNLNWQKKNCSPTKTNPYKIAQLNS